MIYAVSTQGQYHMKYKNPRKSDVTQLLRGFNYRMLSLFPPSNFFCNPFCERFGEAEIHSRTVNSF